MRLPALLATLLVAGAALTVRRRGAARQAERALWAEAGVAPDLR